MLYIGCGNLGGAARAHAPMGAGFAGQRDEVFERLAVALLHGLLHLLERLGEMARLGEQFGAVRQQDVAPDLRIAGRDPREVAETRAGEREEHIPLGLRIDAVDHCEREQVRQVAHGGESRVMRLRRHAAHAAAQRAPDGLGLAQLVGERALGRREDHLPPCVEIRLCVLHAGGFAAGDRMGWHEGAELVAQRAARRLHHVGLGRAHVHDQHPGGDQVLDRLERGFRGRHRHGQQYDVRARDREQGGGGLDVDHPELARAVGGGGRLAVADHALDEPGLLHRQRERPAHQPAAQQAELLENRSTCFRHGATG